MRSRLLVCTAASSIALTAMSSLAAAADCAPASGYSPCLDANSVWATPGEQHFFSIASPRATASAELAFGVQGQLLIRPLLLEVPSADPSSREVHLVDDAVDGAMLFELGLGSGISVGAALGVALKQRGAGSQGITAQRGAPLESGAPRDPRLTVTHSSHIGAALSLEPRAELVLPLGDEEAYAGDAGIAGAAALAGELRLGRIDLAGELGVRARRSVDLGTLRWGSQANVAFGVRWRFLAESRAWVAAEAFMLPTLGDATSERGRDLGVEITSIPAEWLVSVGVRPERDVPWSIVLGAGAGIAVSTETYRDQRRTFSGPTTGRFRALLALRFSPTE